METDTQPGTTILRPYLWGLGTFILIWRTLSHWFYPEWYHRLFGFDRFDESLIIIIGATAFLAVMNFFPAALDHVRHRIDILILIVFSITTAGTHFYLIQFKGFPKPEYLNMTLSIVNAAILVVLFPRAAGSVPERE